MISFTIPSILNDSYRVTIQPIKLQRLVLYMATSFKIILWTGYQSIFRLLAHISVLIGCERFSTVADFSIWTTKVAAKKTKTSELLLIKYI